MTPPAIWPVYSPTFKISGPVAGFITSNITTGRPFHNLKCRILFFSLPYLYLTGIGQDGKHYFVVRNATGAAEPLSLWSIIQVWARMASPRKVIEMTIRNGYQRENNRKPGKTV
jgi:hypothetical protein